MKTTNFIQLLFFSAITFVMSSCVPKATENKAVCGANESFNSVTRSCVNISELRTRPVGTLASDTLVQETAKTMILTYKDANNDSAISCRLISPSANIEAISPQIANGALFAKADLLYTAALNTAGALVGADKVSALAQVTNMQTALAIAKKTYTYSNLIIQNGLIKTQAENVLFLAAPYIAGNSVTKFYFDLLTSKLLDFNLTKTSVENRCDCSGGICSTTISPRLMASGSAGFSYAITDIDGEGDAKIVSLNITATNPTSNFLKPAIESNYVTLTQNSTHASIPYTFTLPVARDYFGTLSFNYVFNGVKNGSNFGVTAKGLVYNCMDLAGSTGPTDITCSYIPNNGDQYDTITPVKAAVTIDDLTFTAKKEGTFANNFSVQYFDLQDNNTAIDSHITEAETYGLVSQVSKDIFVRVNGNAIQVFMVNGLTSTADIKNLINSDSKAKSLVTVTGGSALTFPNPGVSTALAVNLAGGTDAFDSVSFAASNGFATSTNSAAVMFKMSHTDHAPLTPTQYNAQYMPLTLAAATTVDEKEDETIPQVITLPYFDVDNSPVIKAVSCTVDFATPPNSGLAFAPLTTCGCDAAGVCKVSVVPTAFFNGTAKFSYTIRTIDQFSASTLTSGSETVNMNIWEVNNPPVMTITSASTTSAGIVTTSAAPLPNPLVMQENSTGAPSSASICFTANTGGGTDEASQTLTITPAQVAPTTSPALVLTFGTMLIPGAVGNTCAAGQYLIPFTSTANQSGNTNVKITVTDNGTTHGVASAQSVSTTIPLKVAFVDDPPYFIQAITSVQTNEGGAVVAGPFMVDEDQGSSPDEDFEGVKIANITSDNPAVLPVSAIRVFYDANDNGIEDAGESRTFGASSTVIPAPAIQTLETAAGSDVKAHKFYLKLSPIAGVAGNSNITITINDGIAPALPAQSHFVQKSFSLIINPVAALHGGWANISATGIKTDKLGLPATAADIICNYNKAADANKCDTATTDCTGTTAPNSFVTPSAVNVLFWDSSSQRCYRSQAGNDKFSWIEIRSTCPVTRETGAQNFLYDPVVLPAQSIPVTTKSGQYYFNTATSTCAYSLQSAPGVFVWSDTLGPPKYFVPSKVTLNWNSFILTGSGADSSATIEGWNIYRREKGFDYDFTNGFLKLNPADTMTLNDASIRTFTDNTAVAGTVYYYLVRPVDNRHHLATYTPEIYSEVRVVAPVENFAFVHRWMVNQEICNSMHMTTTSTQKVDPTHSYRCPYRGPGESTTSPGFYDIGVDMLVDISESGCPYTPAPSCNATTGCVGIGDPTSMGVAGSNGLVYYDRNAGSCYMHNGAAWSSFNTAVLTAAIANKTNTALNAPLVNISQARAASICSLRTTTKAVAPLTGLTLPAANFSLPTKKEFTAYAAAPFAMADPLITDLEQGFSLNVQSRCNSSSANGIDTAFSDSNIPSTSFIYSLPGSASSGIRSIYTGSVPWGNNFSTEACSSRYGVQDVFGNVAEWVSDKMTCNGAGVTAFICKMNAGTSLGNYDFDTVGASGKKYGFDFLTGPYNDASGDSLTGAGDSFLTQWDFRDELYGAGKFSFPVGMPINTDIATASASVLSGSAALNFLLDIGPTAGITASQLHEDGIIVNGAAVNAGATKMGSFAVGGSYLSGNLSGRYSSELVPDAIVRPDVGFRCFIPVDKGNFPVDPLHTYSY